MYAASQRSGLRDAKKKTRNRRRRSLSPTRGEQKKDGVQKEPQVSIQELDCPQHVATASKTEQVITKRAAETPSDDTVGITVTKPPPRRKRVDAGDSHPEEQSHCSTKPTENTDTHMNSKSQKKYKDGKHYGHHHVKKGRNDDDGQEVTPFAPSSEEFDDQQVADLGDHAKFKNTEGATEYPSKSDTAIVPREVVSYSHSHPEELIPVEASPGAVAVRGAGGPREDSNNTVIVGGGTARQSERMEERPTLASAWVVDGNARDGTENHPLSDRGRRWILDLSDRRTMCVLVTVLFAVAALAVGFSLAMMSPRNGGGGNDGPANLVEGVDPTIMPAAPTIPTTSPEQGQPALPSNSPGSSSTQPTVAPTTLSSFPSTLPTVTLNAVSRFPSTQPSITPTTLPTFSPLPTVVPSQIPTSLRPTPQPTPLPSQGPEPTPTPTPKTPLPTPRPTPPPSPPPSPPPTPPPSPPPTPPPSPPPTPPPTPVTPPPTQSTPRPTPSPTPPRDYSICDTLDDGTLWCAANNYPTEGFVTIFLDCIDKADFIDVFECLFCAILVADSIDELDGNEPQCNDCSICSDYGMSFDCSNLYPLLPGENCAVKNCYGDCIESNTAPECFTTDDGNRACCFTMDDGTFDCLVENVPVDGFVTLFEYCSEASSFEECQACWIFEANTIDQLLEQEIFNECNDCHTCGNGMSFDCSNIIENDQCAVQDCNGNCI